MPIVGLTTGTSRAMYEIARLRLGPPKRDGKQPSELSYFRLDARPGPRQAELIDAFTKAFGNEPKVIHVRLPFTEIERFWDAHYTVYNTAGLLGKADGERWLYLRHNKTGEILVKDGIPTNPDGMPLDETGAPYMPFDKSIPVYSYRSRRGEDVAVMARPEGQLKVLIPALKEFGIVTLVTHSVYNIINISSELAGIADVAARYGVPLPMVWCQLVRTREQISVSYDGKKHMEEHYLVHVKIDPVWAQAALEYDAAAMPALFAQPQQLALPLPQISVDANEIDESDSAALLSETTASLPAPTPASLPEPEPKPEPASEPAPAPEPAAQQSENALALALLPGDDKAAARAALVQQRAVMKTVKAVEYPFDGAQNHDAVRAAANALYAHVKQHWGADAAVSAKGILADCLGSKCGWDWRELTAEIDRHYGAMH